MLNSLVRKKYKIDIAGKVVEFRQLTIMECLEFSIYSKEKDFNLIEWLNWLFWEKLSYKSVDMWKLMQEIYKTAFAGFYSEKKGWKITEKEKIKQDFEYLAYLVALSWEIKLDPISILEKYTPEQLTAVSKWLSYKINEQSDKWKQKNSIMIEWMTTNINDELERVKKARELRLAKNQNKVK